MARTDCRRDGRTGRTGPDRRGGVLRRLECGASALCSPALVGAGRWTRPVRPWRSCWRGRRTAARSKDRRLSPRSFPDDMVANGLSPETAVQVAPLFSRHGDDHRHLRAVLSTAFTPKKVEQLRPATRAIAERLADGIADAGRRVRVRRRLRRAAPARGVRDPVRPPGRGPRSDGPLGGGHRPRLQPIDAARARRPRRGGGRRDARLRPRADRRQPAPNRATTSSPAWCKPRWMATACPRTTSSA